MCYTVYVKDYTLFILEFHCDTPLATPAMVLPTKVRTSCTSSKLGFTVTTGIINVA